MEIAFEIKFTAPAEIPISTTEISIIAKLLAAENTPKSETDNVLAIININKNIVLNIMDSFNSN